MFKTDPGPTMIPMYKKALILFACCFTMFCPISSDAQDTVVVEPGLGTPEAAISTNGNSVVYLLQAGERYVLSTFVVVAEDGS